MKLCRRAGPCSADPDAGRATDPGAGPATDPGADSATDPGAAVPEARR